MEARCGSSRSITKEPSTVLTAKTKQAGVGKQTNGCSSADGFRHYARLEEMGSSGLKPQPEVEFSGVALFLSFSPSCSWPMVFRCQRLASELLRKPQSPEWFEPGAAAEGLSKPGLASPGPPSTLLELALPKSPEGPLAPSSRAKREPMVFQLPRWLRPKPRRAAGPRLKRWKQSQKRPSRSSLSFRYDPTACPSLYKPSGPRPEGRPGLL